MAQSMAQGDLGILQLGDMNFALAAKWIFKYTNDKEALWRKVFYSRSRVDPCIYVLFDKNS